MTVDRAFAVHGSVERAKRKKEEKEVHRKRIAVCAPRGKRKRRKKEDESTTVGDRVRRVQTSRERKPAWREKDEQNHLRCTCCAGGSFGPVLKVYQAFLLLLFLLLLLPHIVLVWNPLCTQSPRIVSQGRVAWEGSQGLKVRRGWPRQIFERSRSNPIRVAPRRVSVQPLCKRSRSEPQLSNYWAARLD